MRAKTKLLILLLIFILLFCGACGRAKSAAPYTKNTVCMGSLLQIKLYCAEEEGADTAQRLEEELHRLDVERLSCKVDESEIGRLNGAGEGTLSEDTLACLQTCLEVSEACGGVFDVSIGPLSALWQIDSDEARLPEESEIAALLPLVGYEQIRIDGARVTLGKGQKLDLGAVGKGEACDLAARLLSETEVPAAVIAVGGSVLLYGEDPQQKEGFWNVGIRDPEGEADSSLAILSCSNCCVSTSGDYEKYLEVDRKRYHHILDPETGWPAESGLSSVTVLADSGLLSDALSTACFLLGPGEESRALLARYGAEAVFITKDKAILTTGDLAERLTLRQQGYRLEDIEAWNAN